ncbi:peptidoglycan-binding domain-containing protein, partial [Amylibacter sp.]|nr:peptidoglycan-binding domain-containing protein [Amylibacter sp.]
MKKLLISFILSLFVAICSFASIAVASECSNDPNECTLIKLCEVSISIDGEKINWSTDTAFLKHVALAQKLDINCGVTTTVDLCDADPNECKVSEICQKATTKDDGTIRWDKTAEAYVTLAKKFGLKCDVNENVSSEVSSKTNKAVSKIFNYKSDFTSKSLLRRKQIQYALKDLGLYSSGIDGLWGKGTSEALNAFVRLNDQEDYSFSQIYNSLKAKVDLPSSFNLSAPSTHNNIYDSKPDYKCTMRKINFQGMGFKFITNNGMTSSTISGPDGTQKFN